MNPNQSQTSAGSVDPADRMSPCASAGASQPGWNDEELDGSDDISDDSGGHDGVSSKHAPLREQDRFLPIANIAKIMKRAIPDNGKIAKDSRECIQECVSEFISFITSEASDRCHQEKRKTINGDDILYAMMALGFDNYAEPLTLYLQKYRETTKTERIVLTAVGVVQAGGVAEAALGAGGAGGGAGGAAGGSGIGAAGVADAGGSARTSLTTTAASECADDNSSSMLFFKTENGAELSF